MLLDTRTRIGLQEIPDEKSTAAWTADLRLLVWNGQSRTERGTIGGIKGGIFSAELPLTILPSILPSSVHLLLPSLCLTPPFTPPWRLQLLLDEREREQREEVVEEVEDARFVRASTLLLLFSSFASPNAPIFFIYLFIFSRSPPSPHLEWNSLI